MAGLEILIAGEAQAGVDVVGDVLDPDVGKAKYGTKVVYVRSWGA